VIRSRTQHLPEDWREKPTWQHITAQLEQAAAGVDVVDPFESPAFIAGRDDIAVVSKAVEQCRGRFGVAKYVRPFAEGEVGGDDNRGSLIEAADPVEEQLIAGLGEWQVAEFVEDGEALAGQVIGDPAVPTIAALGLEAVDQIDDVVETAAYAAADAAAGDGEMSLAASGSARQHDIALLSDEAAGGEIADQGLVDRRAFELEVGEFLGEREQGPRHSISSGCRGRSR
jgi:hypothetical protein